MTLAKNNKAKKSGRLEIRLSSDERAELEHLAGSQPLGTYIKSQLIKSGPVKRKRALRRPVVDHKMLSQLLGMIGQSNVGPKLTYLSDAIENGSLVIDDDVREAILESCAEVHAMHAMLLRALGFEVRS